MWPAKDKICLLFFAWPRFGDAPIPLAPKVGANGEFLVRSARGATHLKKYIASKTKKKVTKGRREKEKATISNPTFHKKGECT